MKNIEIEIKKYLDDRGWDKLRPSDLAKSISIEAAELLELFQWTSLSVEETKADEEKMKQIKKELADVFIYALDMSVLLDLDTEQIIKDKLDHINKKFPAELMRKNAKQESGSGTDPLYLQIKKEYRGIVDLLQVYLCQQLSLQIRFFAVGTMSFVSVSELYC